MKLRVRVNKQTTRVELQGEPTLSELSLQIREIILPSSGLSPDTEFTLSLNSTEPLLDTGQTLSSCGIVSGDLICVILPQSVHVSSASPSPGGQASRSAASLTMQHSLPKQLPAMQSTEHSTSSQTNVKKESSTESMCTEEDLESDTGPFTWEPMLCSEAEEGKVPHSLEVLHHGAQSMSPYDSLMVAVHLLMLETGFLTQGSEVRSGEMPSGWRASGGIYRLHYVHPLCENSLAMVVAVPMGSVLVFNATLKMNEAMDKVRKLSLKPSTYVTDGWAGESAAAVYTDLGKLSRTFKDQLVYPLIAAAREAMALPPVFGLCVLPPELLLRVLRLLDVATLVTLSTVNRHLHSATADSTLWRHLFCRDFRDCQDSSRSRDTNWKDLYKKRFKMQKEVSSFRRMPRPQHLPHMYPIPPNPFNPVPFPLYPPGIIGGEYDERPGIPHGILPRPRYDPIGPLPGHDPTGGGLIRRGGHRPSGNRPADIRRGFI